MLSIKAAGRTVIVGGAFFFLSQELTAAFSDKQVGVFEKLSGNGHNRTDARETIIASLFKGNGASRIENIPANDVETVKRLEQQGYKRILRDVQETASTPKTKPINPLLSEHKAPVYVREWANNGTEPYDGNELRAVLDERGNLVETMYNDSYAPISGRILNHENLVRAGRLKAFVTINGTRFEAIGNRLDNGHMEFIHNGWIRTEGGGYIQAIDKAGNKLYEYLEIGATFDEDKVTKLTEFVPMATDVGVPEGTPFTGLFLEPSLEPGEKTEIFDFIPPDRDTTFAGIIMPDIIERVGVGNGRPRQGTAEQGGTGEEQPTQPEGEGAGEGGDEGGSTPPTGENGEGTPPTPEGGNEGGSTPPTGENGEGTPPTPEGEPSGGATPPAGGTGATPSTPEDESSDDTESEEEAEEPEMTPARKAYHEFVDSLGEVNAVGSEIANILSEKDPRSNEEYQRIWDNLYEYFKEYIKDFISRVNDPTITEGQGFRNWLKNSEKAKKTAEENIRRSYESQIREIQSRDDLPPEASRLLTETASRSDGDYQSMWDTLNEQQKEAVADLIRQTQQNLKANSAQLYLGWGFRQWYMANIDPSLRG